jgi:hypothetical protein
MSCCDGWCYLGRSLPTTLSFGADFDYLWLRAVPWKGAVHPWGRRLRGPGNGEAGADDTPVVRLTELLDYVAQVIRLDERPTFRLSEYRLANGQTFTFHEHEFHALPGITHDLTDDDGAIWLSAERLRRNDPPVPPEGLVRWVELSPDPDKTPVTRDHVLISVPKAECDQFVASGRARAEDCAESFAIGAKDKFDIRLRLEDWPEIAKDIENYISQSWLPWSVAERPRRRSIALYQKLFEVAQLSEMGGAEQAIELVWGSRAASGGVTLSCA